MTHDRRSESGKLPHTVQLQVQLQLQSKLISPVYGWCAGMTDSISATNQELQTQIFPGTPCMGGGGGPGLHNYALCLSQGQARVSFQAFGERRTEFPRNSEI